MRDDLIGYLMNALEPAEHAQVDAQLAVDPQLQRELQVLSRSLLPLAADAQSFEPPQGLAQRTCEFVASQARVMTAPVPAAATSHWSMTDLVVAAGIFLAATLLFFPAMHQSRFAMRVAACQNNLRQISMGLNDYSEAHHGYFPDVPLDGSAAAAGIYATKLLENGMIADPKLLVCPSSTLAERAGNFRVPTLKELHQARGPRLHQMQQQMGGSYGYNLGYVSKGHYQSTQNLHRPNFALMADAPTSEAPHHSLNHGGGGQNVLFEDGHVRYLTTCKSHGCNDHIFENDKGEIAPGLHVNDSVIGASQTKPAVSAASSAR